MSDSTAQNSTSAEMPKGYIPSDHEARIRARWEESNAWTADPQAVLSGQRKPFCVLIPPPNVTGALHLGHALNNTLQDTLTRAHRMMGFETLWMPGTDHAGIATQAVVEKRLQKEQNKRRKDYTREAFIQLVQEWKDEYEVRITNQLKAMGCSCDWSRQRFTMDEVCAKAVREAFFRLFRDGLIYRGKRLVNWDTVLQTAVADDECYEEEHDTSFWYLQYPLTAPATLADGSTINHITVATTRPETYLGDTAVAINPKDPRAAALIGKFVRLPLVEREIPIIGDSYAVLPEAFATNDEERNDPKAKFSTGFVKITPAHDGNDYDVWQRNKAQFRLDAVNMMSPDGRVSDKHGWYDVGQAGAFVGLTMAKARTAVIEAFKELGLMEDIKPHRHSVKHSERTNAIVEPFLSDQWYVKVTDPRLAESANAALVAEQQTTPASSGNAHVKHGDGTTRFYPARYSKTFESWHSNIRDWCISRQLWWGHRIPVWTIVGVPKSKIEEINLMFTFRLSEWEDAETAQITLHDPATDSYTLHLCINRATPLQVELVEKQGLTQDADVLDTWFSSALWPVSTLGWPDSGAFPQTAGLLEAFNPTSVLSTAREIITLWVSRMVMMNRYLLADPGKGIMPGQAQVPFRDVFIHAVVQDGQGRKMSKSLGNGVDPGDIIASHGSDAMRFTLCQMTTQTQDVRMPVQKDSRTGTNTSPKFDLGRNFANKLWNAARFTLSILEKSAPLTPADLARPVGKAELAEVDRWMLSRLAHTVQAVEHSLKNYEFSDYAGAMYDLLWRDFCDWYLESIKPTVAASPAQQAVLAHSLETIVRLLHPIMPFVTEAVFERIAAIRTRPISGITLTASSKAGLLATAGWPQIDPALRDTAAEEHFLYAQSFAGQINQLRASPPHSVPPKRKVTLHAPQDLLTKLGDLVAVVQVMCQIDKATTELAPATGPTASVVFDTAEVRISNLADAPADGQAAAAGSTDTAGERARLTKVIEEKTKAASLIETRLSNPGYADKAPAKLVAESKAQLATLISEAELAKAALAAMN